MATAESTTRGGTATATLSSTAVPNSRPLWKNASGPASTSPGNVGSGLAAPSTATDASPAPPSAPSPTGSPTGSHTANCRTRQLITNATTRTHRAQAAGNARTAVACVLTTSFRGPGLRTIALAASPARSAQTAMRSQGPAGAWSALARRAPGSVTVIARPVRGSGGTATAARQNASAGTRSTRSIPALTSVRASGTAKHVNALVVGGGSSLPNELSALAEVVVVPPGIAGPGRDTASPRRRR